MLHKFTLHSYLNRLITLPLTQDNFRKTLNIVHQVAEMNGYSCDLIQKLLNKKKNLNNLIYINNTQITHLSYNEVLNTKPYKSITFTGNITYKMANLLKPIAQIAFNKSFSLLSAQFFNNKDKGGPMKQSGVYSLACGECTAFRNFKTRLKKHRRAINY